MKIVLFFIGLTVTPIAFSDHENGHVSVDVGVLTPRAASGQLIFNSTCAGCHGVNAQGTSLGPPLIHDIYNPGHHNNKSFTRAVLEGVQQHHWRYGNMPAQPQVGFSDMLNIISFIREVQEQNGIVLKEHKM